MKVIFLFFSLFIVQLSLGQTNHGGLTIERNVSNFGEVEFWVSRVDTFWVTNTTTKTIHILKQKVPRNFEIRIPTLGVAPGQSEPIEIIYKPTETGVFNEKLSLYHSASIKPFFISFKGDIKTFDPYAQLACPSFSTPNFQRQEFNMTVNVIDSLTGEPISNALIELGTGENFTQYFTDVNGSMTRKSNLGLYYIYTEAEGYFPKDIQHYFNPKRREITITLNRNKKRVELKTITVENKEIGKIAGRKEEITPDSIADIDLFLGNRNIDSLHFSLDNFSKNNIVFLIDVSSSMRGEDRLDLLKESMIQLTMMLREDDKVTIITYSDESQIVLEATSAREKEVIIKVIKSLKANGSTYGGKAIRKAFKVLEEEYLKGGNNQVVLATDGGFNGLGRSEGQLKRYVRRKADKGLKFSSLGFGKNKRGKDLIENLSQEGKGSYRYIQSSEEAEVKLTSMIREQSFKK